MTEADKIHLLSLLIKQNYFVPTQKDIRDIRMYMINKIFDNGI